MSHLGAKISALLLLRGLSQAELAKRAGVRQATISELVNGKAQEVLSNTLYGIAKALGVTADFLLDPDQTWLPALPDQRKEAISRVIMATEVLGWEEVARRIDAGGPPVPYEPSPRTQVIPVPKALEPFLPDRGPAERKRGRPRKAGS